MQIVITNGCVEYDGEPVLTEINFAVRENEKIAVVGRNGCGKTTLLRALTGEVDMIKGTGGADFGFHKTGAPVVGCLKQTFEAEDGRTIEEELLTAYSELTETERDMAAALEAVERDGSEENAGAYSRLHERFETLGGYTYKKEYRTALKRFGFAESDLSRPLREFSGGQRTKLALLKLLLSKPQVLLLDEPTNHLDLGAVEWLEDYLMKYRGSCVIVSHDRMFLDKIVNVVYEIEYGETRRYTGNYTAFAAQKKENYERELKDSLMRKKEVERLSALVERFRYKANKAKMAQAKLRHIERIGDTSAPRAADSSVFRGAFAPERETVENAIVCERLRFGYGGVPLGELDTVVKRGEKLGIIGDNGCGKSTLVKTLMKKIPAVSGESRFGLHASVGYFDQTMTQNFSPLTVLEDFRNDFPNMTDGEARTALGAFLFSGEDVFKTVGELSGGEKVRLALCKIFRRRPNILVLDEPTNHMDMPGRDALEKLLADYVGTVVAVSHDRYFINRVCGRLAVFESGGLKLYDCGYAEYEKLRPREAEDEAAPAAGERKPAVKKKYVSPLRERDRKLHRIGVLEEKIAVINTRVAEISRALAEDAEVYSDYLKVAELTAEKEELEAKEAPLMEEWSALVEEVG
ncbi:MAG: ABC-F family ATP-binding cassette domain-containing protein [Clostridia bacterium]|nr:ABC-F family ATP-binding cassette domain-containing protein [Clostridia bacterium]